MAIGETLDQASGEQRPGLPVPEIAIFVTLALVVTFGYVLRTGILDLSARSLVDTDGYMRFLRIEDLRNTWDWFDSVSDRSNFPLGESQHWTRLLDLYILGLALLLTPIVGDEALYGAAVINAPLLLIGVGLATYRAFGRQLPGDIRRLLLPLLLAFPLIAGYASAGRVDHHAALLLCFVITIGSVIRAVDIGADFSPVALAAALVAGMWLSTEFLVPLGLTSLTLAIASLMRNRAFVAGRTARVFGLTSAGLFAVVVMERGSSWLEVEYDKISIVHVLLALAIGVVFFIFRLLRTENASANSVRMGLIGLSVALPLAVVFPGLVRGPFVDVDPTVREIWLYQVDELSPIWEGGWDSVLLILGPVILGFISGAWRLMRDRPLRWWVVVVGGWLVVYGILSAFQIRWALFADLLTLPLLMHALGPWYKRLEGRRSAVVIRPVVVVAAIVGMSLIGRGVSSGPPGPMQASCDLVDVIPALEAHPQTTVLAEQDVGPEILYRTDHRVVATPYHRNEQGILYPRRVMGLPAYEAATIRKELGDRDVGLILVCPGRLDIMQPEDPSGTFYEALVHGPAPAFVRPLELPEETDYLLFAVED